MKIPRLEDINIYHIVHVNNLESIINTGSSGELLSDSEIRKLVEADIIDVSLVGMRQIKSRRLEELLLMSYSGLYVGECVPFYFCPRSVMLYMLHKSNHDDLDYRDGQGPIIHLEFNMLEVVKWAEDNNHRWAFTDSNAGSKIFIDYSDLSHINKLDWDAINARHWSDCREKKQAEFLVEKSVNWGLVKEIGVYSEEHYRQVTNVLAKAKHNPNVRVRKDWYY